MTTVWSRGFRGRLTGRVEKFAPGDSNEDAGITPVSFWPTREANVVTSKSDVTTNHLPVLDIDYNAHLEPSSTPGHFHLYLDKQVTWAQYRKVLAAMAEAGLIERGYYEASIKRGYTTLRLPWVHKEIDIPTSHWALADWVKRLLA